MNDLKQSVPFIMLHENPLYIMEQSQRYAHLSELSDQLQKVTKTLGHYTSLGSQLCDALQEIISSLNQMEFVCTNSTFEKLVGSMTDIKNSLQNHFQKITNSSEKVMKQFVKNDIPVLTELKKNHEKLLEKYSTAQEKYLAISSKNQKLSTEKQNELDDILRESTLTLYDYVSLIELDETKTEHLISQFLLTFPKSFVESIRNLNQLDEDFSVIYSKSNDSIRYYYNKGEPQSSKESNSSLSESFDSDFLKVLNPDFASIEKSIKDNRARVLNSIPNSIRKIHSHLPEENSGKIVSKQGFLYRKKKNSKKFSKKFFTCANGHLSYSKTAENAHNPTFSINLAIATVQKKGEQTQSIASTSSAAGNTDERPFLFKVVTPDCSLTLQALSLLDYDEWIAAIRNGILHALESGDLSSIPVRQPKHHHARAGSDFAPGNASDLESNDEDDDDLNVIEKRKPRYKYGSLRVKSRTMTVASHSLFRSPNAVKPGGKMASATTPPPLPKCAPNIRNNTNVASPLSKISAADTETSEASSQDQKPPSAFCSASFTPESVPCSCADCGAANAGWIVANKALLICDKCAGCHRALGGISAVRSLKLDKLDPYILNLLELFPNNALNKLYEGKLESCSSPVKRGLGPLSNVEQRQEFINNKYVKHLFVKAADKRRFLDDVDDDENDLKKSDEEEEERKKSDVYRLIKKQDIEGLMLFMFLGILKDGKQLASSEKSAALFAKKFLPIHAASIVGNPIVLSAIILNDPNELNQIDEWGWSPLSYAAFYSNTAAVETLLCYRASLSCAKAANPYKIASEKNDENLIEIFNTFIANSEENSSSFLPEDAAQGPFEVPGEIKKKFKPCKNVNNEEFLQIQLRAQFLKQELSRIQIGDVNANSAPSSTADLAFDSQMTHEDEMAIQKAIFQMRKKGRKKSRAHGNDDY